MAGFFTFEVAIRMKRQPPKTEKRKKIMNYLKPCKIFDRIEQVLSEYIFFLLLS